MIEAILGLLNGAVKAWNDWRAKQRDDQLVDTGRQLQAADNLQTTNKEAVNARKSDAEVADMSDADLDSELRGDTKAKPNG